LLQIDLSVIDQVYDTVKGQWSALMTSSVSEAMVYLGCQGMIWVDVLRRFLQIGLSVIDTVKGQWSTGIKCVQIDLNILSIIL
jgi:hypothetical protein